MKKKNLTHHLLKKARQIVVKVGASFLVEKGIGFDLVAFSKLAKEISQLHSDSRKIVLVGSGAIAAGMQKLEYEKRPHTLPQIQAAAAVGQPHLRKIYQDCFSNYRLNTSRPMGPCTPSPSSSQAMRGPRGFSWMSTPHVSW